MLRAYDYVENTVDRDAIQKTERFNDELKLARRAVEHSAKVEIENDIICPGCESRKVSVFFCKWNVAFLRCEECGTIFVPVDNDTLFNYQNDKDLMSFRTSEEYQLEAKEKRMFSWQEILDWIIFRCYRYLGKKENLYIATGGDRYIAFSNLIKQSALCGNYKNIKDVQANEADIAISLNLIHQKNSPSKHLLELNKVLKKDGLLFLSARIGTGFDILALKEYSYIYPYDYISLLSKNALEKRLNEAGFELLDYSTPGCMDVSTVWKKQAFIANNESFIKTLMRECDERALGEFQRFLQKTGMSSYAHIVAKKVEG